LSKVPLFRRNAEKWAAVEELGQYDLAAFLSDGALRAYYALEMSLRSECPDLLADMRVPAAFSNDLLSRMYKKASWPNLIIGRADTGVGVHRDSHNLAFWTVAIRGRKRWRVFDADDEAVRGYERVRKSAFDFDAFSPAFWRQRSLGGVRVFEDILEPGEIIYIPRGAPHATINLDDTIAVSTNFLDPVDLDSHEEFCATSVVFSGSDLCWAYAKDFRKFRPSPPKEITFFESAGFENSSTWCTGFLERLTAKAAKDSERKRNLGIVRTFCGAPSA
jgi:hypothetical protein